MNAIKDNEFSQTWSDLGRSLPRPKGIVCVSAHWETVDQHPNGATDRHPNRASKSERFSLGRPRLVTCL
jgi:aromatic ring-opening dioxygenase catalytic subunit (LigB family)